MAGVGEAASLVGLLTFTLNATSSIYNFIKSCQTVESQAQKITREVDDLKDILVQCLQVASRASACAPATVSMLENRARDCKDLMEGIQKRLNGIQIGSKPRRLEMIVKIAVRPDVFPSMQRDLGAARDFLLLILNTLSCELHINTHDTLQQSTRAIIAVQDQRADQILTGIQNMHATMMQTQETTNKLAKQPEFDQPRFVEAHSTMTDATDRRFQALEAQIVALQKEVIRGTALKANSKFKKIPRLGFRTSTRKRMVELYGNRALNFRSHDRSQERREEIVRLVKPGFLVTEEKVHMHARPVSVELENIHNMDLEKRKAMIVHLQHLRVLIWLLRADNYMAGMAWNIAAASECAITHHSQTVALMDLATSILPLSTLLSMPNMTDSDPRIWRQGKDWLEGILQMGEKRDVPEKAVTFLADKKDDFLRWDEVPIWPYLPCVVLLRQLPCEHSLETISLVREAVMELIRSSINWQKLNPIWFHFFYSINNATTAACNTIERALLQAGQSGA